MLTAVYIAPHANASSTLGHLHDIFSSQQSSNPEAVYVLTGDFNCADKESAARTPSACQMCYHWSKVYSNIKMCFRARPLPHVGPDRLSLLSVSSGSGLSPHPELLESGLLLLEQLQNSFGST